MRFLKSEGGAILPFTLLILGTIILAGALAVNTVRVEHRRSVSQSILDICVLNAAAQRQTLAPRTVLDDCLAKHGFQATIVDFAATTGQTKSVTAEAATELESFFLREPQTYALDVSSTAQESLTNLEIILALDVSDSLLSGTPQSALPFNDLKAAARLFVDRMLREDTQGNVKITLLPYNSAVNLGADLASRFNVVDPPQNLIVNGAQVGPDVTQKRCLDLANTDFQSSAVSTTAPIRAFPFIDMQGSTSQTHSNATNSHVAPTNATNAVATLPPNICSFFRTLPSPATNNVVFPPEYGTSTLGTPAERILALQNRIDGLQATGDTSINQGMRWALAFLDPAMQPVFAALRSANRMPASTQNHPRPFDDATTIKVVVLMSDGRNVDEPRLDPAFLSGPSPFWIGNDGNISWFNASRPTADRYWVPHLDPVAADRGRGQWRTVPWRNATNTGAQARQMDYTEVWRRMKVNYVTWHFHARSVNQLLDAATVPTTQRTQARNARSAANLAAVNMYLPPAQRMTAAIKDSQLQQVCNLARTQGIYVYSLFFETALSNSPVLQACARSPEMYYQATPANIQQAFSDIALHISRLQLTE